MDGSGKARMISFISSKKTANHAGADSCIASGMVKVLQIANKTSNEYRTAILVADGRAQCSGDETEPSRVFQRIMGANVHRIPINTIYTGQQHGDDWTIGKPLLERLARATNGKFKLAN